MKTLNYIIVLLLIPAVFACDEFLDKQPLDRLSPATFWKTQDDAEMALAGVYRVLQESNLITDGEGAAGLGNWDTFSDNAYTQNNSRGFGDIADGKVYPNSNIVTTAYYQFYRIISACNNYLRHVDNIEWTDETIKKRYSAEVKFIRAFGYYWLTQCFGDVPLVTEISMEEMNLSRTPKSIVLEQVYADLDYAIANLPDIAYSGAEGSVGHVVKGSALALKARVKLFNGEYADAATLSKQIIDGGKFTLATDYTSNFIEDSDQDNCPEIIFSVKFFGPINPNRSDIIYGWWRTCSPIMDYINSHEEGDMRLKWNVAQVGEPWPLGFNVQGHETLPEGRYLTNTVWLKWVNPTTDGSNWTSRGNDNTQIRYAEVLLVFAEAQNELTGPDGDVYAAINAVRNRAMLPDLTGLSQDEMREAIRHERRVELVLEGQRYFDLKRWRIAGDVIPKLNNPPNQDVVKRYWSDHLYLWPIPQSEIDKDPVNLIQTEGY